MYKADELDLRILEQLQVDASLTNQALAALVHASPPTCLRRVRRLREAGLIQKVVALVDPQKVGLPLTAIVEITLDTQNTESCTQFERHLHQEVGVQQSYRVSTGPDFVVILVLSDMAAYHEVAHRLFTAANNVRNIRTFFSISRGKFDTQLPLKLAQLEF